MKRRDFMRAAGGATVATAATAGASAPAAAQEEPDFGPYLDDARGFDSATDLRGQEEVTIEVGAGSDGLAFDPAAIWVDPGTELIFEWTGEGGGHNVARHDGIEDFGFEDIVSEAGHTWSYTVTEEATEVNDGIILYNCAPHVGQGMKGGIAVGDDVPTIDPAEAAAQDPADFGTDIHEHWVGVSVLLMLVVSLVFTFYTLKYGESPHTSGAN
ncbi:MAG: halocyanin domain-containing protein [Natronomonas sp.]